MLCMRGASSVVEPIEQLPSDLGGSSVNVVAAGPGCDERVEIITEHWVGEFPGEVLTV